MAEPFVFHFKPGPTGPEQMYIADIRAECALCRHVQFQRYYHSTPLHTVTPRALQQLALGVGGKLEFECPNCGEPVRPAQAVSTTLTWGFADDAGLIRGYLRDAHDAASLRWQFTPRRRLDPQDLPGWEPDPAEAIFATLDDALVEEQLGRALNPKSLIREVLEDWRADPAGGAVAVVCDDMRLIATADDASVDDLLDRPHDVLVGLADCVPESLATHRDPTLLAGRFDGWMPAGVDLRRIYFAVASDAVDAAFARAFEVANLTFDRTEAGFENITTPRDSRFPRAVSTQSVLRRAVYTGITPGDAARLTAEEIIGNLLRVW